MTKTTLRLPEPIMDKLRERSRTEGRSINEVAVEALLRGLGQESPDSVVRILGALLARPATARYDRQRMRQERLRSGMRAGDFSDDLDWIRGSE